MEEEVKDRLIKAGKYLCKNWKNTYHILVETNRFGVNNKWWERKGYGWIMGVPVWRQILRIITIYSLIESYKRMKFRCIECGFIHPHTALLFWPKDERLQMFKDE